MVRLNRAVCIVILCISVCLPSIAAADKTIGEITRLKGGVTVYRDGSKIGMSAKNGMDLQQNDRIKTGVKAYLRFKLNDGSIMTLGQTAELTLDTFTYNPEKKERVAFFNVALGKLRIFANKMLKYRDNRFQIKTPTAVAGVRGTVFMVWVESPAVTRIACFDSAVEVASVFKPDDYVVLTKNILTSVSKGAAPTQPVLMTEKMFRTFQSGFDGDIKPVDEETGFEDVKEEDAGDEQRDAPDPTDMDTELPLIEAPELPEEEPVNVNDGEVLRDDVIDTETDIEQGPDQPEPPVTTTLPGPPAVPVL